MHNRRKITGSDLLKITLEDAAVRLVQVQQTDLVITGTSISIEMVL